MKLAVDELLLTTSHNVGIFRSICLGTTTTATKVLRFLLVHLSQKFLDRLGSESPTSASTISAAAGVISSVIAGDESRKSLLVDWCTASSGAGLGHQTAIRRAVLSVLAQDKEAIVTVFEKSLSQFGDELYIKHAAALQQNSECSHYQATLRSQANLVLKSTPRSFC
jgi:telomere length regulation protein